MCRKKGICYEQKKTRKNLYKVTKYADDYGQLYEVDIPEDDVLPDEDALLYNNGQVSAFDLKNAIAEYLLDTTEQNVYSQLNNEKAKESN